MGHKTYTTGSGMTKTLHKQYTPEAGDTAEDLMMFRKMIEELQSTQYYIKQTISTNKTFLQNKGLPNKKSIIIGENPHNYSGMTSNLYITKELGYAEDSPEGFAAEQLNHAYNILNFVKLGKTWFAIEAAMHLEKSITKERMKALWEPKAFDRHLKAKAQAEAKECEYDELYLRRYEAVMHLVNQGIRVGTAVTRIASRRGESESTIRRSYDLVRIKLL